MRSIKLLHLNSGTNLGGTETMILRFLDKVDQQQFEVFVGAFFPGGEFLYEAEKRGARSVLFKIKNAIDIFSAFIRLFRYLKKNKIDIVHLYGFWTNIGGRIAAKLAKTPIIICGQRTEDKWRKPFHSRLDWITSRWVDLYISVFNKGKELLISRDRIPERKIVVIHNGIDMNWANSIQKNNWNLPISERLFPTIGMVAAFNHFKAHNALIQAAPKILEKFPHAKFILSGDGYTKKKASEMINDMCLTSQFIMPGFVKDIRQILIQLDIFVLATHSEGLPVSVLEAMSMGIPVVASNIGGIPELMENGKTGILVESNNSEKLSSAIIEILENPGKAKQMSEAAKERVRRNFTIEKMVGQLTSIYLNLALIKV
jgi:glycosyltransferase involved in cell wall biosynthesis